VEHKELRQLLNAMIRSSKLSFEKTGNLLPFAIALNEQGKISQLAVPQRPDRSPEDTNKAIEAGLKLVAQQLACKAVGFCAEVRFPDGSRSIGHAGIVFLLEHSDGCAYRVTFPDFLEPKNWNAQRTMPRLFVRTNGNSLPVTSTRW
jgi:hypothetical protein